ncbi:putative ABC transporter [Trypanosoma grayi]|uniref:putative ABC transporter n=1 Tax=Trypanosoma grayi TaxID=71804 RepID=UPI0004F429D4|nr:putative ABC transporter [Trypanosoma grayi]KEG09336.1 putative ABC transporter [Trypanosoma grayi]
MTSGGCCPSAAVPDSSFSCVGAKLYQSTFLPALQHLYYGFKRGTGCEISSSSALLGIFGLLLAVGGVHHTAARLHLWQPRVPSPPPPPSAVSPEGESLQSVCYYWTQLSDVIVKAPRTSERERKRHLDLPTAAAAAGGLVPEAVRILWEDEVRYSLDEREVIALLRRTVRSVSNGGVPEERKEEVIISAASLALLWRLQLVRSVHEALVVAGDVNRCSSDLDDLEMCSALFHKSFIRPLPQVTAAAFLACWACLSSELLQLRCHRRALQLRNTWSLARYVYTGGPEKLLSSVMICVLTTVGARSACAGLAVRERVGQLLRTASLQLPLFRPPETFDGLCGSRFSSTALQTTAYALGGLLALEWARLVITAAVGRVTRDYIRMCASRHRDSVKRRLYEALAHTPLSFFDTLDPDDVEQLLYYANDLEGVDVHVHDFIVRAVQAVTALVGAAAALDRQSRVVVVATVATTNLLTSALAFLRRCCSVDTADWDESCSICADDVEEVENGCTATDGMMLRGMEIIAHIRELRPYGADTTLMSWWTARTARYQRQPDDIQHVLRLVLRSRRVWAIDAVTSLTEWLLPAIVAAHAAVTCQQHGILMEAIRAVQDVILTAADAQRVSEVVLNNAYKANTLERMLDSRHWEDEEEEEVGEAAVGEGADEWRAAVAAATAAEVCNHHHGQEGGADAEVCGIRAHSLQFQYPSAPTVNALVIPATFSVQLQDEVTGTGRLVCVTGPSGCGKTTLLHLLLALYKAKPGSLMVQLRRRRRTQVTSTEHIQHNDSNSNNGNVEGGGQWIPVTCIPRGFLRTTLFSYVPQTATLFPGATIAQNVSLQSHVSVTHTSLLSRVRACALAAGCGDFIKRLPQGLLTPLSVSGGWGTAGAVQLSCGQGQRLMLARALFHGGGVLLMDEPTSGLDSAAKRAVMAQWRELLRSGQVRGVVCVTHDAEVLEEADEIVRL